MDLLVILLVIAIIGFGVYLITTYIPMVAPFKTIIIIIACIFIFLYMLRALGVVIPNVMR